MTAGSDVIVKDTGATMMPWCLLQRSLIVMSAVCGVRTTFEVLHVHEIK